MSAAAELQKAIIARLLATGTVTAYLGQRIYDNPPQGGPFPFLSLGPAQELDDSADCIDGQEVIQQVDIWTQEGGSQLSAKEICGAVRKALHGADLALGMGWGLVLLEVESARYMTDPDEKIAHGVLSVRAIIEEVA